MSATTAPTTAARYDLDHRQFQTALQYSIHKGNTRIEFLERTILCVNIKTGLSPKYSLHRSLYLRTCAILPLAGPRLVDHRAVDEFAKLN